MMSAARESSRGSAVITVAKIYNRGFTRRISCGHEREFIGFGTRVCKGNTINPLGSSFNNLLRQVGHRATQIKKARVLDMIFIEHIDQSFFDLGMIMARRDTNNPSDGVQVLLSLIIIDVTSLAPDQMDRRFRVIQSSGWKKVFLTDLKKLFVCLLFLHFTPVNLGYFKY